MKKYAVILPCFMLIQVLGICQRGFPRQALINSDTVALLTIDQVKILNTVFISLDECWEIKDSLKSEISAYKQLQEEQSHLAASQAKELILKEDIMQEQQKTMADDDKIAKKMKRRIYWLKVERNALVIGLVVLASVHFLT